MTMRTRPAMLVLLGMAIAACHPPRSPREVAESRLTGTWTAHSASVGEPRDTGQVAWRLRLDERDAGRVEGRGGVYMRADSAAFDLSGVRGRSELTLQFAFGGERVQYHGGIVDAKTIVGEMILPRDTVPVTFTKE